MQSVDLVLDNNKSFVLKEAYKSLRTNILFCGKDIKVIAVTSCAPNEGKSNVSFNIAKSLADDGKKVIYIDADLRKSVTLSRLKVGKKVIGLSHFLSGQNNLEEVIYATNVDNLDMIFAGVEPPNPAELLGNRLFSEAVEGLREAYDYIIIDTPPVGSVTDCSIISRVCDGIIMVVASGSTNIKMARNVKNQLEKTGCKILGAVLNKVDTKKKEYYSGYYGAGYYSYKKYGNYYKNEKGDTGIVE